MLFVNTKFQNMNINGILFRVDRFHLIFSKLYDFMYFYFLFWSYLWAFVVWLFSPMYTLLQFLGGTLYTMGVVLYLVILHLNL